MQLKRTNHVPGKLYKVPLALNSVINPGEVTDKEKSDNRVRRKKESSPKRENQVPSESLTAVPRAEMGSHHHEVLGTV